VVINAALLAALVAPEFPQSWTLGWVGGIVAITMGRSALAMVYRRRAIGGLSTRAWEALFGLGSLLNGIVWGMWAAVLVGTELPFAVAACFVVGGMVAGASSSTSTSLTSFYAFAVPAVLPVVIRLGLSDEPVRWLIAATGLLFGVAMTVLAHQNGRVLYDSARLRLLNAALADEQAREKAFRIALLQESPTPTLIVDRDGRIEDVNAAATELCGHPPGMLRGGPVTRWLSEPADPEEPAMLSSVSGDIPVRVRVAEVDHEDRAHRVFAMVDLRAEQEVLRKQAEAVQAAEAANHAKSAFLAGVSHELRTPLNAIIGYAELLGEDIDDDGQKEDLGRILAAGRHLLELVDDVLDMSKVEAGRSEIQWARFDLVEVLHEAIDTVEGEALRRRISMELRAPSELRIRADRLRVRQVVTNLLSNATRFARTALVLEAVEESDRIRVTCADDGPGVPEELAPRLFRPFVRGTTEASRSGLGLALSREFANRMAGSLHLADAGPLPGAVFVFELQRS